MEIVYNEEELKHYMENAVEASPDHPVLVDRYLTGQEIEVDAICDGENVLIPGIMEHVERAGVHSGDSISVYPPQKLTEEQKAYISRLHNSISKRVRHYRFNEHSICTFER